MPEHKEWMTMKSAMSENDPWNIMKGPFEITAMSGEWEYHPDGIVTNKGAQLTVCPGERFFIPKNACVATKSDGLFISGYVPRKLIKCVE